MPTPFGTGGSHQPRAGGNVGTVHDCLAKLSLFADRRRAVGVGEQYQFPGRRDHARTYGSSLAAIRRMTKDTQLRPVALEFLQHFGSAIPAAVINDKDFEGLSVESLQIFKDVCQILGESIDLIECRDHHRENNGVCNPVPRRALQLDARTRLPIFATRYGGHPFEVNCSAGPAKRYESTAGKRSSTSAMTAARL
jgi:hypothetical protein